MLKEIVTLLSFIWDETNLAGEPGEEQVMKKNVNVFRGGPALIVIGSFSKVAVILSCRSLIGKFGIGAIATIEASLIGASRYSASIQSSLTGC